MSVIELPRSTAREREHTQGAWVNARGSLARHLAERLGCTATAQALWHTDAVPVSVGRAQRAIPERTRRLVEDRDRGCAYPGCTATRFVEIHHLRHWEDGGGTDYDNLLCLCPHHHSAHHAGQFTITPTGNTMAPFTFTARAGWTIKAETPPGHDNTSNNDTVDNTSHDNTGNDNAGDGDGDTTDGDTGTGNRHPRSGTTYTPPLGERADYGWISYRKRDTA
ncbi:HNH endonuclease signature motif containing protein [Nostocoides australiense]